MSSIEFVNHASVLLSDRRCGLLTDPWLFGEAFHRGWALLVETPAQEIEHLLERTTHIWLSHEHPDHFSPGFFQVYGDRIRSRGISVIFQKTRDGRVARYLRDLGITVIELKADGVYALHETFSVRVVPCDVYDSALLVQMQDLRIFNLNDCPLHSEEALAAFVQQYGQCDVLLTQFSYAAWKGGKEDIAWRQRAAQHKIVAMHRQIAALQPKSCVLFANFVRFANELNAYLNDAVNHPDRVLAEQVNTETQLVFMAPGEVQSMPEMRQSPKSLDFWRGKYAAIADSPLMRYEQSVALSKLKNEFQGFQNRLLHDNNAWLMRLVRRWGPGQPFSPTRVRLIDQPLVLEIDLLGDMKVSDSFERADVSLHSSSLSFLFRFPFGLDTLFVNGCFEVVGEGGFERFARCFAIGNMNAVGVFVRWKTLGDLAVIRMLLRKLQAIRANLVRQKQRV